MHFTLVAVCFTLSGLAALVYQTAWTRQFALVFGTSELAVATVLAAYMAGLALGARVVQSLLPRILRPVRCYALLELAIAVAALALVPVCLWLAEQLLAVAFGGLPAPPESTLGGLTLFYLCAAFITLLLPTTLMGATLPLLVRDGVADDAAVGRRVGWLYAWNTAGAVAGALLGALWLLPALGLRGTLWSAAAANVLVCGLALWVARAERAAVNTAASAVAAPTAVQSATFHWVLPLILLSGAVSFFHEVLWTRLLSRLVGGTIQAFGIMVAAFLLGIALGGALGGKLATQRERSAQWFVVSQVLIALFALLGWYALTGWAARPEAAAPRIAPALSILLPMTFAIGLTFPLATRILARGAADAAEASARVYSWNTAGAIVGALSGGFLLIPALRYEGSLHFAVLASLALALAASLLLMRRRWAVSATLCVALALALWLARPPVPESVLRASTLRATTADMPLLHYSVGRSADVIVLRSDSTLELRTNGLPEAGINRTGAPPMAYVEAWMAPLAALARPELRDVLIVGYGGGNVVSAVPPSVRTIDVIELEPEVMLANRVIAAERASNPLTDERVNLIINDARGALALSSKRYDAILSQPSHPWTAGASHLYTREYMVQAREHLSAGGVFAQWMSLGFVDESLLRSLIGTMASVFSQVRVYKPSSTTLLFLGSDLPMEIERKPQLVQSLIDRSPTHYWRMGLSVPEDLVAALLFDDAGARRFSAGAPLLTDDDNRLATSNVYARGLGLNTEKLTPLIAAEDVLRNGESFVWRELAGSLAFDYIWRRIMNWGADDAGALGRVQRMIELLGDDPRAAQLRYMTAMHRKDMAAADRELAAALARWPDDDYLRYYEVEKALPALVAGQRNPALEARLGQLRADAAVVVRASRAAGRQDWDAVHADDEALAAIDWRAPWNLQAQQLRAEWRARVLNPDVRVQVSVEGVALADRVIASQPDVFWHALRAQGAVGLGRPEVILESVAAFAKTAQEVVPKLSESDRPPVKRWADAMRKLMLELRGEAALDRQRYNEISQRLNVSLAQLGLSAI